jgi:hypothetical protein
VTGEKKDRETGHYQEHNKHGEQLDQRKTGRIIYL